MEAKNIGKTKNKARPKPSQVKRTPIVTHWFSPGLLRADS